MKKQINKTKIAIYFLIVLLVLALTYIIYIKSNEYITKKQVSSFNEGVLYGYEGAIFEIAQMSLSCQPVSLTMKNNQTIELIAVECLQLPREEDSYLTN